MMEKRKNIMKIKEGKGELIDSPDGTNRDALTKEHIYTALVTPDWITNIGCLSEAREADLKGCRMVKFQKVGVKLEPHIEKLNWLKTFYHKDDTDFKKEIEAFYSWLDEMGWY